MCDEVICARWYGFTTSAKIKQVYHGRDVRAFCESEILYSCDHCYIMCLNVNERAFVQTK
jgi:hypothetical protein